MVKILLFGGTTEGRRLWEYFGNQEVSIHISVTSDYGKNILQEYTNGKILKGRLTTTEMIALMNKEKYDLVIDATHPYAMEATKNIKAAAAQANILYQRLKRNREMLSEETVLKFPSLEFPSLEQAVCYLKQTTGNIFVTTGSKELSKCADDPIFLSRLIVRILPNADVISQCIELGLTGKQLIAMQGPFSEELNTALLLQTNASYLLTKASGETGGFSQKAKAAMQAGVTLVVIGKEIDEDGLCESDMIRYVCDKFSFHRKRQVMFVGVGMGHGTLTEDGKNALMNADVIIGAKRLLDEFESFKKHMHPLVAAKQIAEYIRSNTQFLKPAIVFSGDVGFYSGAKQLYALLQDFEITTVAGISAPIYFFAKLGLQWQDVSLSSLHGVEKFNIGNVLYHKTSFFLLGKAGDAAAVCKQLCNMGFGKLQVYIGEKLSYPDERIITGIAEEFVDMQFDPLSVLLVNNANPWSKRPSYGIADASFYRVPKVPMTKREVRAVSMSYLHIEEQDIFYDIGAGTGSVSIEGAYCCPHGQVYAIEHNEEAIALLLENKKTFGCGNVTVVKGHAPTVLDSLPAPDKVFIGGSNGELKGILMAVLSKNPYTTIVINSIAIETLSSVLQLFEELGIVILEITQVSIAKGEKAGSYHLMKGQNPIFVISGRGSGK